MATRQAAILAGVGMGTAADPVRPCESGWLYACAGVWCCNSCVCASVVRVHVVEQAMAAIAAASMSNWDAGNDDDEDNDDDDDDDSREKKKKSSKKSKKSSKKSSKRKE